MKKEMNKGKAVKLPKVVSSKAWEAARRKLLVKEKKLTRARDALAADRRRMPWLAVEKEYEFDGPEGKASLLDLFEGRRQLIVYRAFFEPGVDGWPKHGCRGCSLVADQVAHVAHLNARDTTLAFVSRAADRRRAHEGAHGLGDALVQHDGRFRVRRRAAVPVVARVMPRTARPPASPTSVASEHGCRPRPAD